MTKLIKAAIAVVLLAASVAETRAERPIEQIKTTTEKVMGILRDKGLQGESKTTERRRLIRVELDKRFAWAETARGSLGRHWAQRSPAERKEFVALFSEFLQVTYLAQFDKYHTDIQRIDYVGEKIKEDYASVQVQMLTTAREQHPVEYRLQKMPGNDNWRIYDTVIEGVSLIKNYRDQFDAIIAKSAYAGLIKEIRSKLETAH